jgi:outer membrane protein TolC
VVIDASRLIRRFTGCALSLALAWAAPMTTAADGSPSTEPRLVDLISEAVANNPELAAAQSERDAAQHRIAPAGALEDPMLELGMINTPLDPLSLRRDDMTMKMLGLSQKLPFPGKRDLRRAIAAADADSMELAVQEARNKLVRDVRVAYEELVFNAESQRIVARTRTALEQLEAIARSRYAVGQAEQNDVIDSQTELERLRIRQLLLARENTSLQSQLRRLLGRTGSPTPINVGAPTLAVGWSLDVDSAALAMENRPQLLALQALVARNIKSLELTQREYYPDFDLKLQYGQRDRAPDGMPRDDMVSLTVELNLPIWRKSRLQPQVAEARAASSQAQSMLAAQRLETQAALDEQRAIATQSRQSANVYQSTLLPQVRASISSALAAYRVGGVDFLTLRLAQLRELDVATELAETIASHNKAVAEIDLLVGRSVP